MSSKNDNQEESSESVKSTAESTRFHAQPEAGQPPIQEPVRRRSSDMYYSSAKSIRLNPRGSRASLAVRLAIPIIAFMLLAFVIFSLIVKERVFTLQIDNLMVDAANTAYTTGILGRLLITHQEKFLLTNPDFLHRAEWPAGEHWLVTHGFVSEKDWVDATGFQLDEYAPASVMERAGRKTTLAELGKYLSSDKSDTEIVAVFLLDSSDNELASVVKDSFRLNLSALRAIPVTGEPLDVGNIRIQVDYVGDMEPEPVVRGIARIFSNDTKHTLLGTSVVVLQTVRHIRQHNSLLLLLLSIAVPLCLILTVVCWYSARRVTMPMRRLAADMQAFAEGDYSRRTTVRDNDETGMLSQTFNSMAERLRLARLNEQETSRLESDLVIARDIQNNLLPLQTPRVRGLDIYTFYRPAKEIGGDYFDFLPVDDQHMGMVIADASGKSIPAALVMSTTRAILRFVAPGSVSAAETLSQVNAILSVDIPKGMFVTAYYVILDPLGKTMLCSSAGHTPLLIARSDGSVELMNPGGIALGFDSGPIFQRSIREQRVKLDKGDRVLLYTDGVVECVNSSNEEYSDRRLREFLRRNRDLTSHDFVGALMADLDRHRGTTEMRDDTTIVTFMVL